MYKLGVIGCGNMGEAVIKGILDSGYLEPEQIVVYDINEDRKRYIVKNYGLSFGEGNSEIVKSSRYILVAVKPQNFNLVLNEIKSFFNEHKNVLISIAAGIPTYHIRKILGGKASVIRVMPNTPVLMKKGMSVISKGKNVLEDDFKFVLELIKNVGDYITIDERYQNIATAISGSGPAYFFLFCKYLIQAAIENGLSPEVSRRLVVNTMIGSGELIKKTESSIDSLIEMVKSPGGTTEKALEKFDEGKIDKIIQKAVQSAIKRGFELEKLLEE